jgi:putative salt-induced outer membrane protein YdiY
MKNRLSFQLIIVAVLTVSLSVSGGQIVLKNGDRLTGTITTMADGKVTVETALAGTVEIPVENVQTISSDEPLELHLNDGTVIKQSVEKDTEGMIKTAGSDVIESQRVALADVEMINPPEPEAPKWKGDLSAGLTYASGNTSNESYAFSGNLSKRTENDRITFRGDAAKKKEKSGDEKVTTEDWWIVGGKYDYFLNEKTYVFGESSYEKDEIADLDRRVILGGGLGYQWIEKETQNFSTELGVASVYEKYETSSGGDSKFSLQMGYHYDQQLNKTFSFIHDLNYYPSTEQFGDYFLTSSAEVRAKINGHLFTSFKVLFDYDATPATGKGSTDTKYMFGIGVNF